MITRLMGALFAPPKDQPHFYKGQHRARLKPAANGKPTGR